MYYYLLQNVSNLTPETRRQKYKLNNNALPNTQSKMPAGELYNITDPFSQRRRTWQRYEFYKEL
jgi:hypothetical protein